MIGFVLTGHGQFSTGLKSAVDMVAGDQPFFEIVPFEGSEAVTYGDDLKDTITKMASECEGVLVFVDLWGGTPFNQSMMISSQVENMEIVTGANLPMLLELVVTRTCNSPSLEELASLAFEVGSEGVRRGNFRMLASVDEDDDDDEM